MSVNQENPTERASGLCQETENGSLSQSDSKLLVEQVMKLPPDEYKNFLADLKEAQKIVLHFKKQKDTEDFQKLLEEEFIPFIKESNSWLSKIKTDYVNISTTSHGTWFRVVYNLLPFPNCKKVTLSFVFSSPRPSFPEGSNKRIGIIEKFRLTIRLQTSIDKKSSRVDLIFPSDSKGNESRVAFFPGFTFPEVCADLNQKEQMSFFENRFLKAKCFKKVNSPEEFVDGLCKLARFIISYRFTVFSEEACKLYDIEFKE
mmetsp:Transcript_25486/g.61386  ORF Transcript_25486/g.61386 Transcript_25486/m.61386 type:complete len:259 (-) Transcript_25486:51-827(-)